MRKDRDLVFELRKKGLTYAEIQEKLGIAKSTLSEWFKDISWSKHVKNTNNQRNIKLSEERIKKLNQGRKTKLDEYYKKAESEAEKEFMIFKKEPLFMAGLMAYAGEGDKRNKHLVRISNSELYINKIFIKFSEKYLCFKRENIKCALILYSDHDINLCTDIWSRELNVPKINFHKTQIIAGKEKTKRLQFGIGMVIISNTFLKKKLMKWIDLVQEEIMRD